MRNRWTHGVLIVMSMYVLSACHSGGTEPVVEAESVMEAEPVSLEELLFSENPVADFLGADGVELNYADEEQLVFHSFAGLFVCERDGEGWMLVHSLDLEPLDADRTQGDGASLILAEEDRAWVMPGRYGEDLDNPVTYEYVYSEERLDEMKGFLEQEDSALQWSYSEAGMEIYEKIYDAVGMEELYISNPYPMIESDSRQYSFLAVGAEGLSSLQYGRYFEQTGTVALEQITVGMVTDRMETAIRNKMDIWEEEVELMALWYDREKSERYIDDYLEFGKGAQQPVDRTSIIVLQSNLKTGEHTWSFEANTVYTDWSWILIWDETISEWVVEDYGSA